MCSEEKNISKLYSNAGGELRSADKSALSNYNSGNLTQEQWGRLYDQVKDNTKGVLYLSPAAMRFKSEISNSWSAAIGFYFEC